MGKYDIPVKYLFSKIISSELVIPPEITNKTIDLGTKYSPDFVCTPFKYTLGTLIECLDKGANVLIQIGGGCRYGYYYELQKQILEDLGYKFKLINLVTAGKTDIKKIYLELKKIEPKFKIIKGAWYLLNTIKMVKYMDLIDDYIRRNIGFIDNPKIYEDLEKEMLDKFVKCKNIFSLWHQYRKYLKKLKKVHVNKNKNSLKVGVIGELYTLMEPFANYYIEEELAKYNIEVIRFTNVHYLLFEKSKKVKEYLNNTKEYVKYRMGADAADNIARTKELCKNGIDGIIHIKAFGCTPEIGAMPIINKVCNDYKVPVIFFSFDSNTSEVGIKTRLEAFKDMLEMRKNND